MTNWLRERVKLSLTSYVKCCWFLCLLKDEGGWKMKWMRWKWGNGERGWGDLPACHKRCILLCCVCGVWHSRKRNHLRIACISFACRQLFIHPLIQVSTSTIQTETFSSSFFSSFLLLLFSPLPSSFIHQVWKWQTSHPLIHSTNPHNPQCSGETALQNNLTNMHNIAIGYSL